MTIEVQEVNASYHMVNGAFICDHTDVTIEKACCSIRGSSGYIECACSGMDDIICDNPDCTGLEDDIPEFNNDCWG